MFVTFLVLSNFGVDACWPSGRVIDYGIWYPDYLGSQQLSLFLFGVGKTSPCASI